MSPPFSRVIMSSFPGDRPADAAAIMSPAGPNCVKPQDMEIMTGFLLDGTRACTKTEQRLDILPASHLLPGMRLFRCPARSGCACRLWSHDRSRSSDQHRKG